MVVTDEVRSFRLFIEWLLSDVASTCSVALDMNLPAKS